MSRKSMRTIFPSSGFPNPAMILIASIAPMQPTVPETAPKQETVLSKTVVALVWGKLDKVSDLE